MSSDKQYYEMLLPETRKAIEADLDEKIAFVRANKFIPYGRADEILNIMEDIFTQPPKPRMPSLLIYGDSHNGKSSIIKEFVRRHPMTDGWDSAAVPVISIEAPSGPDTSLLYDHILKSILIPFKKSHTSAQKEALVTYHLTHLGTRMLFIDEINNILAGSATKRAQLMNAVKSLSNELSLSIVLSGISTSLMVVRVDEQMQSRFRPLKLQKWSLDEKYASLLASIEVTLPFKNHPGISNNQKLATKIFDMSEGILGYIIEIVEKCAISALKKGNELITDKDLQKIDFSGPSEHMLAYKE